MQKLTKLDHALDLARRGFAVFPLVPNAKVPAIANWQNLATTDEAQIRRWWTEQPERNIGAPTQNHVVVDVDPRNGGDATFAELTLLEEFPKTARATTRAGGDHIFYALPPHTTVKGGTDKLGKGVDVKSWGGYVVAAGSTIDGKPYQWANERPVAAAPQWLIDRCNTHRPRTESAGKRLVEEDDTAVTLAQAWLANHAPDAHLGAIDDTAFKVAARFYDFGVSVQTATELLTEWSETHAFPPMQADRIQVVAESAGRNRDNPVGTMHPGASGFEAVDIAERPAENRPDIPRKPLAPMAFGDLDKRTAKPVEELIPGLVEKGVVTFLSAPGGTHKSRIALHWGRAIHNGLPVYGRDVQRATFVYVSCEDDLDEVTVRAHVLKNRLDLPDDDDSQYWNLVGEDAPLALVEESGACKLQPFWHTLTDSLRAIPGHKFIVLDGTYNMLRFAGQAKINETSVLAGIKLLQHMCMVTDSTIVTLWHPSQAGQERGDASGWSVAWHNAPRARLSLSAVKDRDDVFELRVEKRNHGPKGKPITLHWSDGMLLPRDETTTTENAEHVRDVIVKAAIDAAVAGAPMTSQKNPERWQLEDISTAAGWPVTAREVKEALGRAVVSGLLTYAKGSNKVRAGYYPPGEESLAKRPRENPTAVPIPCENRGENRVKTGVKTKVKTEGKLGEN